MLRPPNVARRRCYVDHLTPSAFRGVSSLFFRVLAKHSRVNFVDHGLGGVTCTQLIQDLFNSARLAASSDCFL